MLANEFTVNKTTRSLYKALFALLETTPFGEITVNDICQTALVSRSTFYTYFEDKYHLVRFALEQERDFLGLSPTDDTLLRITTLLTRIQEKEKTYRNLMGQANRELNQMLVGGLQVLVKDILLSLVENPKEAEVLSIIYSSGIAGSILWWLEHKFPVPIPDMARYQYESICRFREPFTGEKTSHSLHCKPEEEN